MAAIMLFKGWSSIQERKCIELRCEENGPNRNSIHCIDCYREYIYTLIDKKGRDKNEKQER